MPALSALGPVACVPFAPAPIYDTRQVGGQSASRERRNTSYVSAPLNKALEARGRQPRTTDPATIVGAPLIAADEYQATEPWDLRSARSRAGLRSPWCALLVHLV